jgi:hypothetical protein
VTPVWGKIKLFRMVCPSKEDKIKELNQIKYDIEDACAKGKISEMHYNLLNNKIESFLDTSKNKTSDDKLEHANKTGIAKRSPL